MTKPRVVIAVALALLAMWWWARDHGGPVEPEPDRPSLVVLESAPGLDRTVPHARVLWLGRVIYEGEVKLNATIERVLARRVKYGYDNKVYDNANGQLPERVDGYYRSWVHPTRGVRGPGPQRIIVGQRGDWYYTPDGFETLMPLGTTK